MLRDDAIKTPARHGAAGSPLALALLLTFGLTAMDLWCDVLGHAPALAGESDLIAASLTNPRVLWSLSLIVCCALIVAFPRGVERVERVGDAALPLVAATLTALYAALPRLGGSPGPIGPLPVVATGVCYGWMEVRLLGECARLPTFSPAFWAIAASQAVKTPLASLVGMAPDRAQVVMDALLAASVFPTLLLLRASRGRSGINAAIEPGRVALRGSDQVNVLTLLVLLPVMNSVARALSNLAFWGTGHAIAAPQLVPGAVGAAVFLGMVALTFGRLRDERVMGRLFVSLVVLLGCLVVFDDASMSQAGVPATAIDALDCSTELYSHHLFWVVAVFATRTVDWHPYRLAALTELSMSVVALGLGITLQAFTGVGRLLVNAALYAVVVVSLALLWRMRCVVVAAPQVPDAHAACERLAGRYGLTPRESQVFELLAQGRSRVFIQEELSLSDSTIKAHTSHVYQKLGVHSKQELISLVRAES